MMDLNVDSVPCDNMPWDKSYSDRDALDARRYRLIRDLRGGTWAKDVIATAKSADELDRLVDAKDALIERIIAGYMP